MASFTLHIQYVDRPPETRTFADRDKVTLGRDIGDIALRDSQVSGACSTSAATSRSTTQGSPCSCSSRP
ncbi:MAG: hypothetical protein KC420_20000 [Myxococcales bacterium]|nr:hypothetical protein [Myxococcales bacterium]